MYSNDDLTSAVQVGIFSKEAVVEFRDHVEELKSSPVVDDEQFRLITGFNDIFVVIACALLLVSITWIGVETLGWWFGTLLQTITAWLLAEYFTRKRLMALPSIVLLLAFVGGVIATSVACFLLFEQKEQSLVIIITSIIAAFAAWAHWLRFKVPITVAAGAAALAGGFIMLVMEGIPESKQWANIAFFGAGLLVFMLAMYWGSSDTNRDTRRSDVAFWCHLVAAPLLVHPVFSFLDIFKSETGAWQAGAVAALYIVIAVVSISIDRRALMVSALMYVLYAFSAVLQKYGVVSLGFALTAFMIGSGLLLLSAFWHNCREAIIQFYPDAIQTRLPVLK